jgi:uncharacterized protein
MMPKSGNHFSDRHHAKSAAASPFFLPLRRSILGAGPSEETGMSIDPNTQTELEAAAFRRLIEHLKSRPDVQNIDLMNLAGFCRNCLSNWLKDAADARGVPLSKDDSRMHVYGMSYEEWKAKHQNEASAAQLASFEQNKPAH